ncbi:glycosyltransferase involved in cell wall biosynthesis [Dokdonella fugitiva]|uniref:Glycosyltransferase involved in cell wall biosynthesis n=1 Tax=Dokdonella fugitiva TaxID=328517 RepID=A0A839ETN4_9GAMM|nr:glycosyltransferase family 4 protein [Dokdonella fugitiva]MBA8887115.1 glycosyltransferase involved in cell wall biosynthesis [Dokdonella fugitiva]
MQPETSSRTADTHAGQGRVSRGPRPLRVLMVLESNFPVIGGGGAESQVRTLALRLRERGHRVTVLTPLRDPELTPARIGRHEGIPVLRIAYPRIRLFGSLVLWLRLLAFLARHGRRYDAWHVHIAHHLGALTTMMGRRVGRTVVVKVSGWWELKKGLLRDDGGFVARVGQRWLRGAHALQAISHRIEAELLRHGFARERIVALPNAIDMRRFGVRAAPPAEGVPTAVFVGRLVPEKGLGVLLDAWAAAFPQDGRARLRLVGAGPLEASLRAQAERLGIAAQVEFLGHRSDVEHLLREADFGVLTSTIEGLSNTLLEFMASCLPVVASRVSGSEDFVVDGRNGWLFEPGDRDALARCLADAVAHGRAGLHRLGCNARADVAGRADLDVVVDRLLALYRGDDPARVDAPAIPLTGG